MTRNNEDNNTKFVLVLISHTYTTSTE